jgi:hypothetical protein
MSAATSLSVKHPDPDLRRTLCSAWGTGRIRDERFAIVVYTTSRVAFEGSRRTPASIFWSMRRKPRRSVERHPFTSMSAELPDCRSVWITFPMRDGVIPTFGRDRSFVETVVKRQRELIEAGFRIVPVDLASRSRPEP